MKAILVMDVDILGNFGKKHQTRKKWMHYAKKIKLNYNIKCMKVSHKQLKKHIIKH